MNKNKRILYRPIDKTKMVYEIDLLSSNEEELKKISEEQGIGLSLEEMMVVKSYFEGKKRNPTDVELQSIGQAWSEHCCYKSSKFFLKKELLKIDSKDVLAREDAGVMAFDDKYAYALRIESHNHPSALEPYGGAATGIGGIVRDVLCMGARPIALVDPLYFGPLDYPTEKLPKGTKHPKYIFRGVVAGIRDYGNRIGVPTVSGCIYFDEGYVGNPIVNVGCVGFMKRNALLHSSAKDVGDLLVLVGGRTGRDGIHGVTFASKVLSENSEETRGAVQLGDPITKEPLIHACLEASRKGLVEGMKDLGGGGLSCVVGEMVHACSLGAEVELDKVPLKEEGLRSWEIWISESQERMMLAVKEKNLEDLLKIFRIWDVNATVIGHVIKERVVRLFFNGRKVFELESDFLTKGPEYCRPYKIKKRESKENNTEKILPEPKDYNSVLLNLLSSVNICSRSSVIRQYDHEVQGKVVIKPLQGKMFYSTHGDACVLKPLRHSYKGLALATSGNPLHLRLSPYWGAMGAIDELCRNLVSVGARPHSFTNCLNLGDPQKPERMWELREVIRGLGKAAKYLKIPTPSGNVSLYNESTIGSVPPTVSILGVGLVDDIRKCVTSDFKKKGNPIYLVGETYDELGGSEYLRLFNITNEGKVPRVTLSMLKQSVNDMLNVIHEGLVDSCHDVSQGGLAVSLSEMCFGGKIGARIDVSSIGKMRTDVKLFSESNTRWLVEVRSQYENEFLERVPYAHRIGYVEGSEITIRDGKKVDIGISVDTTRRAWENEL
ncbi:MAG: phosphoribosylformylglycinamidine synthase subunit PurL [Thermoplasmata archaeon]